MYDVLLRESITIGIVDGNGYYIHKDLLARQNDRKYGTVLLTTHRYRILLGWAGWLYIADDPTRLDAS